MEATGIKTIKATEDELLESEGKNRRPQVKPYIKGDWKTPILEESHHIGTTTNNSHHNNENSKFIKSVLYTKYYPELFNIYS